VENQNNNLKKNVAFPNYPPKIPQGAWTGTRVNLTLCSDRPAINCPSHGIVLSEQMSKFCTGKIILCIKK
jgi:hypothetical protein